MCSLSSNRCVKRFAIGQEVKILDQKIDEAAFAEPPPLSVKGLIVFNFATVFHNI